MEHNLEILGASAIEDKLQEGVADTLRYLTRAGIKVWMLTGDKKDTSISTGYACQLLSSDTQLIDVEGDSVEEVKFTLTYHLNKYVLKHE